MEFKKYQHLERFGTPETRGIEFGTAYVFPKIDGSNASVWHNDLGFISCGSRRRHLSIDEDNAGFCKWAYNEVNLRRYLAKYPNHRLFGEWLVPHSLKTYKDSAWNRFYVFDVAIDREPSHAGQSALQYLHYDEYREGLEEFGIDYISPICTTENATYEQFVKQLEKNAFLIEDGKGVGEGIVIKNYDWSNSAGNQVWAKIVTSEFKEKHAKTMGAPVVKGKSLVEEAIADQYVTKALCNKVLAKISLEQEFTNRMIPRLLNTVYYDVVKEEAWNMVKKHKNPTINFGTLQHFINCRTKENLPEIFE